MNDIEKIEKVKKDLRFGAEERCLKTDDCEKCEYYNPGGNCFTPVHVMRDALSVIEELQEEIEKAREEGFLAGQNNMLEAQAEGR